MKICTKCKEKKPFAEYYKDKSIRDGHTTRCKVCLQHLKKKYRQDNIDKVRANARQYYKNNADRLRANMRKYRANNIDKLRVQQRKRQKRSEAKDRRNKQRKERWKSDVKYRLTGTLRTRLRKALKRNTKSVSTLALLGCSVEQLKRHLEKQFQPGMSWDKRHEWHIDHIVPCNSFDLTDPIQQQQCFHYSNLQPLWKAENISKNDKELHHRTWIGTKWVYSYRSALTTLRSFTSLPSSGM